MAKSDPARRRRHRSRLAVGVLVIGAALLTACNPLSLKPVVNGTMTAPPLYTYTGPSDAWFEIGVTAAPGYEVRARAAISDLVVPPAPRSCIDTNGVTVVECADYGDFNASFERRYDGDAPNTFWRTIVVHPGERVTVPIQCLQAGAGVGCPPETTVTARTVDQAGKLIGDLVDAR